MSSYNFLRAVSDGLAEAIRYRTNLKRQRRENEYNYNRDWQRNENEYQRDLGRKRDELDYMTDYNWKQQQKVHDRQVEWDKQAREDKIAQRLDFIDKYNPANVNRFDYNDVITHNTYNDAYDMPFAIKYEKSPEQIQKELEKKLELEFEYANKKGQADLSRQKALVDYRNAKQPKDTNRYRQLYDEAVKLSNETGRPLDECLMILQGKHIDTPRAVKGSGSKSVAVGGSGFGKEAENALNNYYKMVGELADAQSKASGKGNVDSVKKILDINPELPKEQRALLEGTIQTDQAHQNRQLADSLKNYRDRVEIARQRANEYLKPYGRMIDQNGQMVNIMEANKNNIRSIVSKDDVLEDVKSRNPQLEGGNVVSLHSDGTQTNGNFVPDTIPDSVPFSVNQQVNPSSAYSVSLPSSLIPVNVSPIDEYYSEETIYPSEEKINELYKKGKINKKTYEKLMKQIYEQNSYRVSPVGQIPWIGNRPNRLYVNPNVFKPLPNNSYMYK